MKKVGLLAACDRDNYGDILFPIIFEDYFKNKLKAQFNYYGLIKSDISKLGGPKTESIVNSLKNKDDVIVICGGDTMAITWTDSFLCFENSKIKKILARVFRKAFGLKFEPIISQYLTKEKAWNMPYNLPKKYFQNSKIVYNCVSGSGILNLKKEYKDNLNQVLKGADYIAVREEQTKEALLKIGLRKDICVYPDSAILMSEFYSYNTLKKLVSKKFIENYLNKLDKYIVFQIAEHYSQGHINTIVNQLKKIYEETSIKIVLLPIGKAEAHSDQIPLKKIYEKLKNEIEILYIDTENVFETMYVLGNTELYIGTSLHGAITALAYGKKHVALTTKVKKLLDFLKVWSPRKTPYFIEIEDLSLKINEVLKQDILQIQKNKENCIKKAKENFENILEVIEA